MSPAYKLSELSMGRSARICAVDQIKNGERLSELGFYPGATVRPLFSGIFGEPKAYLVQNAVIALRRTESEKILVNELP